MMRQKKTEEKIESKEIAYPTLAHQANMLLPLLLFLLKCQICRLRSENFVYTSKSQLTSNEDEDDRSAFRWRISGREIKWFTFL